MTFWSILQFLGGVGLFLLGMKLMTEGLKVAAGDALRRILGWATLSRARGVATGALITSIVQSSSAVIFATIGFVNAGILGLGPAVSVIYGANLGTTMTTWLVSVAGLQFSLKAFALPFIGFGMLLQVMGRLATLQAFGTALTGFGLFFLGLDVLTGLFQSGDLMFTTFAGDGLLTLLLYCLIGAAMTVLMQSSSAALAVILTAAAGGLLGLPAAAAMMIGANIGTTSTAVFAAIGATPNARRVAASHVLFNLVEATAVFILFGVLIWWVETLSGMLGAGGSIAVSLAIFHTTGKLIGLALMWPLTPRLVQWLERQFVTAGRELAHPEFLDKTALETPALGLQAAQQELQRVQSAMADLLSSSLQASHKETTTVSNQQADVLALLERINDAIQSYSLQGLPEELATQVAELLRITHDLEEMAERANDIETLSRRLKGNHAPVEDSNPPTQRLAALALSLVRNLIIVDDHHSTAHDVDQSTDLTAPHDSVEQTAEQFEQRYQTVKQQVLTAGATGRMPARQLGDWLDYYSTLHRIVTLTRRARHQGSRQADQSALTTPSR